MKNLSKNEKKQIKEIKRKSKQTKVITRITHEVILYQIYHPDNIYELKHSFLFQLQYLLA